MDAGEDKQYQILSWRVTVASVWFALFEELFDQVVRLVEVAVVVTLFGAIAFWRNDPVFPALASGSRTRCMDIVSPIGNDRIRARLREQNSLPVGIS